MNTRVTWTLWVAALLLGGLVVLDWRGRSPEGPDVLAKVFPALEADAVDAMELSFGAETEAILLRRVEGRWMVGTNPVPAQRTPIESLLTNFLAMEIKETIPLRSVSPEALAEFGFNPARLVVRLAAGGSITTLSLGGRAALTEQVYVRVGEAASVYLVDAAHFGQIPADAVSLRDPRLLPMDGYELQAISVRVSGTELRLRRIAGGGEWGITHPIDYPADPAKLAAFTQLLGSTRVGFLNAKAQEDLSGAFRSNTVELSLSFSAGPETRITMAPNPSGLEGTAVAQREAFGDRVLIGDGLMQMLASPFRAFNKPGLIDVPMGTISRIEAGVAERFVVERGTNGLWTAPGPSPTPLDPALMNRFLENLKSVVVVDYLGSNLSSNQLLGLRLQPPVATFTLTTLATNSTGAMEESRWGTIEFGVNQVDLIPIRLRGATDVFWGQFSDLLSLPKRLYELRDRSLWKLAPPDIVTVISAAGQRVKVYERAPDGSWFGDPVANAAAAETVFRFGVAKALSWVGTGEQRLRAFGIQAESPTVGVQARVDGATQLYSVSFGNRSPAGNVYASTQLPGSTERLIFEFPGQLHAELLRAFPAGP